MAIIGGGVVGTDRRAVPVRSEVEDGTHVVRLTARGSCPAEDGEAPDCGRRSAPSLPEMGKEKTPLTWASGVEED